MLDVGCWSHGQKGKGVGCWMLDVGVMGKRGIKRKKKEKKHSTSNEMQ